MTKLTGPVSGSPDSFHMTTQMWPAELMAEQSVLFSVETLPISSLPTATLTFRSHSIGPKHATRLKMT